MIFAACVKTLFVTDIVKLIMIIEETVNKISGMNKINNAEPVKRKNRPKIKDGHLSVEAVMVSKKNR